MQIEVTHLTRYRYQPQVKQAQHVAHLTPLQDAHQQLLSYHLEISPAPDESESRTDVFGNVRSFFSIHRAHDVLSVIARSTVLTNPRTAVLSAIRWEEAQEHFRYRAHAPYDPAVEFTFASTYVPIHADFLHYALASFAPGEALLDCAFDLMARIHKDFAYVPRSTEVNTTALEAMAQRRGVCQDFAHVMIACWRAMGLPARYVSGYLLTHPPEGQERLIGADASHAWVSLFIPSADQQDASAPAAGQWLEFDPTNNRHPAEDYVTLARGRDFSDVSPLRGVILGDGGHQMDVEVTVSPV